MPILSKFFQKQGFIDPFISGYVLIVVIVGQIMWYKYGKNITATKMH